MATSATVALSHGDQELDLERQKTNSPSKLSKLAMVFDQSAISLDVSRYPYQGSGTLEDPYIVEWIPDDPRNPITWPIWYKSFITGTVAFSCLAMTFVSSGYAGGVEQVMKQFDISREVATLGVSLFVLGFAIGPFLWAPLSEMYGRQVVFLICFSCLTVFIAGAGGSQNMQTLIILRFFAGALGSSPLTNSGGVIADIFSARQRGLAMTGFIVAPFAGPILGPVVGGFVATTVGWRWLEGVMAIFTGVVLIFQALTIPETYGPVLLRRRADRLSKKTGRSYISVLDKGLGRPKLRESLKIALSRPWILLFREAIVFIISIYMAIMYGTLYLCFGAFPIVFHEVRGWPQQIANLPLISLLIGILLGVTYNLWDNGRYARVVAKHDGDAPAEARLPPAILGSILLPIGLFWFAWSSQPSVHWIVPQLGAALYGASMLLIYMAGMLYLIDSYVIYAASALAANALLRALLGAIFPLFTTYLYHNLGINWATSLLAFLAMACMPFPFLFHRYGGPIRMKCKYAAQAQEALDALRRSQKAAAHAHDQDQEQGQEQEQDQNRQAGPVWDKDEANNVVPDPAVGLVDLEIAEGKRGVAGGRAEPTTSEK